MTIAEMIALQFNNDGMRFIDDNGLYIGHVCTEHKEWKCLEVSYNGLERYEFRDGSAIVFSGPVWDIEGSEPFSFKEFE